MNLLPDSTISSFSHTLCQVLGFADMPSQDPLTLLFYPHSGLRLHGPLVTATKLRRKSCLLAVSSNNDADSRTGQLPESTSTLENELCIPLAHQEPIISSLRKTFHQSTEQRQDGRFESTLPTESAWGLILCRTFLFKILYIPALTLSRIALFWNFAPSVFLGRGQF